MSGDGVGPAVERVAVVLCAVVGIVLAAAFLPAATTDAPALRTSDVEVDEYPAVPTGPTTVPGGGGNATVVDANGTLDRNATDRDEPADASVDPLRIGVDGTSVPGRTVNVTALRGSDPVEDAVVEFDGERVGETGADGTVRAPVPGTDRVNVTVTPPDGAAETRSFDVRSDLRLVLPEELSRESETTVRAAVPGHPVGGAEVLVDGEVVATTDGNGLASITLPDRESATVAVRYGDLRAEERLDLSLDLEVSAAFPAAGSPVTVETTYGERDARAEVFVVEGRPDDPAAAVGSDPDAVTANGSAEVLLPPSPEATVVVSDGTTVASTTLDGLLLNLGLVVVAAASVVSGVVITYLRLMGRLELARARKRHGEATGIDRVLADVGDALVGALERIPSPAAVLERLPSRSDLPTLRRPRLPSLPTLPTLPALALPSPSLPSWRALTPSAPSLSWPTDRGNGDETPDGRSTVRSDEEGGEEPSLSNREVIRAGVRDLGRLVGLSRVETATPGEIGRRALDRAYPRAAVRRIVETVREVEYGDGDPTPDRARAVRAAVERIADEREGGDEE